MNAHSFCQQLLSSCINDLNLKRSDFSVTKSSIGGYEVQGPSGFYYNASSACCKWGAVAEAMEHFAASATLS
jgi:hypothetical protein